MPFTDTRMCPRVTVGYLVGRRRVRKNKGERRRKEKQREKGGERRKEKGERRKEKGERRKEKGEKSTSNDRRHALATTGAPLLYLHFEDEAEAE